MSNTPQNNKHLSPFSMRLNQEERALLESKAGDRPLSAYVRWLLFKDDLPDMPKKRTRGEATSIDHKALAQLLGALGQSRIASNINQLARAANSGSLPVNQEVLNALKEAVEAVHWMRETLIKALGLKPHPQNKLGGDNDDPQR
ncbi:plasmid mobilization relaxosome protein MobC [Ketobacter sp.]